MPLGGFRLNGIAKRVAGAVASLRRYLITWGNNSLILYTDNNTDNKFIQRNTESQIRWGAPPAGNGAKQFDISDNGEYLVALTNVNTLTKVVFTYRKVDGVWTEIGKNIIPFNSNAVAMNHAGTSFAVVGSTTPYYKIFNISGNTVTEVTGLPSGGISYTGGAWNHDGSSLALASSGTSPYLHIYNRSGDTFTRLSNPASLPNSGNLNLAWNHDGSSLAITGTGVVYNRSGDTFTKLASPSLASTYDVAWTSTGSHLAFVTNVTPYVHVYSRSGDTFTKLANPTTLPGAACYNIAWSKDNTNLIVMKPSAPPIIYTLSGSTLTVSNTSSIPTYTRSWYAARSISNTEYLISHNQYPYMSVCALTSNTTVENTFIQTNFTQPGYAAYPGSMPTISTDKTTLYIPTNEQGLKIYTRSFDTLTLSQTLNINTASCGVSSNNKYLALGTFASPYVRVLHNNNGTYTELTAPATQPPSTVTVTKYNPAYDTFASTRTGNTYIYNISSNSVSYVTVLNHGTINVTEWSPDGQYLAIAHASGLTVYQKSGDTYTLCTGTVLSGTASVASIAWFSDSSSFYATSGTGYVLTRYDMSGTTFSGTAITASISQGSKICLTSNDSLLYADFSTSDMLLSVPSKTSTTLTLLNETNGDDDLLDYYKITSTTVGILFDITE